MNDLRAKLEVWTAARNFEREVQTLMDAVDAADFFCNPKWQWLRDAHLASLFATKTHARFTRLVPRHLEKPDFEVELRNGRQMRIEATEADQEGRRRGEEYRRTKLDGYPMRNDPGHDWALRRAAIPKSVAAAANRKAAKIYPPDTSLLIYVNLGTYGCWRDEIERELVDLLPGSILPQTWRVMKVLLPASHGIWLLSLSVDGSR